jgi:hypothetical protein
MLFLRYDRLGDDHRPLASLVDDVGATMTMPAVAPRRGSATPAKAFLAYLGKHLELRNRIRAFPNRSVAYVGDFSDGASWVRLLRRQ